MINYFINYVKSKMNEEKGQGMVEYALLVGLISIAAIVVIALLGPQIVAIFTKVTTSLTGPAK